MGGGRVSGLLHGARAVLLNLGVPGRFVVAGSADRVRLVEGQRAGTRVLPVLGAVAAPDAVLIRPDGHVVWVSQGSDAGLSEALTRWLGGT